MLDKLTKRQRIILFSIIDEYIKNNKPVSSGLLFKKYNFGLSPASIRNEMYHLTKFGFLYQPHISAGRIPTNKSFCLFARYLLKNFNSNRNKFYDSIKSDLRFLRSLILKNLRNKDEDLKFLKISRVLSKISREFVISGILEKDKFFKFGLRFFFASNFSNFELIGEIIDNIDEEIKRAANFCDELFKIFIGKEIPFNKKSTDLSLIISKKNHKKRNIIIAILGPKRMDYKKNLYLLNSTLNFLK